MEGDVRDLAKARLLRAEEMLSSAKRNYAENDLKTALNRSYYAILHAMRSVNALEQYDSSKHSGVIAYFIQHTLKTGRMDSGFSVVIKKASYCRNKSDYDDFYIVSREETAEQIKNAEKFVGAVKTYLEIEIRDADNNMKDESD